MATPTPSDRLAGVKSAVKSQARYLTDQAKEGIQFYAGQFARQAVKAAATKIIDRVIPSMGVGGTEFLSPRGAQHMPVESWKSKLAGKPWVGDRVTRPWKVYTDKREFPLGSLFSGRDAVYDSFSYESPFTENKFIRDGYVETPLLDQGAIPRKMGGLIPLYAFGVRESSVTFTDGVTKRFKYAQAYFFREIFDDWMACHGYDTYEQAKDGLPAAGWPGFLDVGHPFQGGVEEEIVGLKHWCVSPYAKSGSNPGIAHFEYGEAAPSNKYQLLRFASMYVDNGGTARAIEYPSGTIEVREVGPEYEVPLSTDARADTFRYTGRAPARDVEETEIPILPSNPPVDDDTPMEDTPPDTPPVVVAIVMPDLRSDLNEYEPGELSATNANNWYNIDGSKPNFSDSQLSTDELFDEICPDKYSAKQGSKAQALALSGGTGCFGQTKDDGQELWWSTNFSSGFTEESYGEYYSRNAVLGQPTNTLMGAACQRNGTTYVKWASRNGVAVRTPYMQFTTKNEAGADVVLNYSIPVPLVDGQIDEDVLNTTIAQTCPKNGCFFVMDLNTRLITFQIMDGAKATAASTEPTDWTASTTAKDTRSASQIAADQAAADKAAADKAAADKAAADKAAADKAAADKAAADKAAADKAAADKAAADKAAADAAAEYARRRPVFTTGYISIGPQPASGVAYQSNSSLSGMDYSRTWLPAFSGYQDATSDGAVNTTSFAAAQSSPTRNVLTKPGPQWFAFNNVTTFLKSDGCAFYSGWLRPGTNSQMVGWVINLGTQGSPRWAMMVTSYGVTSLAPPVKDSGYNSPATTTFFPTSNNQQGEILMKMYMSTTTGPQVLGFIFDGSVGAYGQVTWISQI
jgi:hypothetical protein